MKRRIPGSVRLAAAALATAMVTVGWLTARAGEGRPGWAQAAFAALLPALILGGLLTGRRLAWLWGHHLSMLLAGIQALTLGLAVWRGLPPLAPVTLLLALAVAALAVASVALGRRSALAFFDLLCPACGAPCRIGADLLFRTARCRACHHTW